MTNRESKIGKHTLALEQERKLWQQVIGKGPMSPEFDQPLFEKWLAAVGRTALAFKAMRQENAERPSVQRGTHPT